MDIPKQRDLVLLLAARVAKIILERVSGSHIGYFLQRGHWLGKNA